MYSMQTLPNYSLRTPVPFLLCSIGESMILFSWQFIHFGSNIPFKTKEGRNGYMQMAWDELEAPDGRVIPRDRILIYCTCVNSCTLLLVGCCPQLPLQIDRIC